MTFAAIKAAIAAATADCARQCAACGADLPPEAPATRSVCHRTDGKAGLSRCQRVLELRVGNRRREARREKRIAARKAGGE